MRLIDGDKLYAALDNIADHLFETKSEPQNSMAQTIQYVMGIVWDQPGITPPPNDPLSLDGGYSHEIVHCKDCVNLYFKDFSAFCSHRVSACRPEGFCEYGERRRPEAGS